MANAGFGSLSFGSEDVDNMIGTKVCEGCKVFFFFKASILGFHGFRRPNTNGSQFFLCTVAVGLSTFFFVLALCCSKTACAEKNFLHKLEATPHLNGKHVVFGKVRSAKGAKGVNWVYSVYYFRGRCKMEFTLNFRLKSDMRPFNLLHKLKIMSCKSSCKICFFLSNFGVFSHSKGLRANWHLWGSLGQVGSSALAEVLGQTDMLAFWDSLGTNGFCLRKGSLWGSTKASLMRFSEAKALEDSKKTILYMRLPVFLWGQSCMNCWLTTPPLCRENNWSCCCCWVCDLLL